LLHWKTQRAATNYVTIPFIPIQESEIEPTFDKFCTLPSIFPWGMNEKLFQNFQNPG